MQWVIIALGGSGSDSFGGRESFLQDRKDLVSPSCLGSLGLESEMMLTVWRRESAAVGLVESMSHRDSR